MPDVEIERESVRVTRQLSARCPHHIAGFVTAGDRGMLAEGEGIEMENVASGAYLFC